MASIVGLYPIRILVSASPKVKKMIVKIQKVKKAYPVLFSYIPRKVEKALGLKAGDSLRVEIIQNTVVYTKEV